jgi:hypothetical protein
MKTVTSTENPAYYGYRKFRRVERFRHISRDRHVVFSLLQKQLRKVAHKVLTFYFSQNYVGSKLRFLYKQMKNYTATYMEIYLKIYIKQWLFLK